MTKVEARSKGLIWSRRKGADNRLEFKDKPPIVNTEEIEARQILKRKLEETKFNVKKGKKVELEPNSAAESVLLSDMSNSDSDSDL